MVTEHGNRVPAPNPVQWLGYVWGARLPDRYRDWVRHDNTAPTWLWRQALRTVVLALPVAVVACVLLALLTPAPLAGVVAVSVAGVAISLLYTLGTARELSRVRLVRHGMPDVQPPRSDLT